MTIRKTVGESKSFHPDYSDEYILAAFPDPESTPRLPHRQWLAARSVKQSAIRPVKLMPVGYYLPTGFSRDYLWEEMIISKLLNRHSPATDGTAEIGYRKQKTPIAN
jgi:hypothetical protein